MSEQSPNPTRRSLLVGGAASVAAFALVPNASAAGVAPTTRAAASGANNSLLTRWAADTWHSLDAMTVPSTGLPADNIPGSLRPEGRSGYTSPTNIGGYLWSAVVARELGIISAAEAANRIRRTLLTLKEMEHHNPSGMYYNWYDEATGKPVRIWPDNGSTVHPFVSSVDNGWLGAALWVVRNAVPEVSPLAGELFGRMRWDAFYNPTQTDGQPHPRVRPGGLMHGGFYPFDHDRPGGVYRGTHIGGGDVWLTTHHYDTIVSETRITSYLGIMTKQVPQQHYFAAWRTFPATCDWNWHEMQPVGVGREYLGIKVFEGAYTYRGMRIVPGWGGSMFEELMPNVFVPEEDWGPQSWGLNHPLHVRAQREHGLVDGKYGYWGFSPSSNPAGGYREYGVDALGMNPEGYFSDQERTNYDVGWPNCNRPATNPNPTYGDGVVTPHAAALALMYERGEATANLIRIQKQLGAYGPGGFYDAVAVRSRQIAKRYLSLDQAMVMGAIGNVLKKDVLRRAFVTPEVESMLRPIIAMEKFSAGPVA
jgi:hypothetical protein